MTSELRTEQVVVVTGAGSGIGAALARRFALAGASLGLLDRDEVAVRTVADELTATGVVAHAYRCDVASWDECATALKAVGERFGRVDILVNNAGLTHLSHFRDTDLGVLRRIMDVNFWGAVHCSKAALEPLIASRGQIVILSSIAGFAPLAGRVGYAASKHALQGLFGSLRAELAPLGVHVLLVCPGFTRTNIGRNALGADGGSARAERTTTGRDMDPGEVAEAIFRAVRSRRRMIVLSPVGKASYYLMRLAPALYERLMARTLL